MFSKIDLYAIYYVGELFTYGFRVQVSLVLSIRRRSVIQREKTERVYYTHFPSRSSLPTPTNTPNIDKLLYLYYMTYSPWNIVVQHCFIQQKNVIYIYIYILYYIYRLTEYYTNVEVCIISFPVFAYNLMALSQQVNTTSFVFYNNNI